MSVRGVRSSTRLGGMKTFWLGILVAFGALGAGRGAERPPSRSCRPWGTPWRWLRRPPRAGFTSRTTTPISRARRTPPRSRSIRVRPRRDRPLPRAVQLILLRDIVDAGYASLFGMTPHEFLNAASISFDLDGQPLPVQRTANKWNSSPASGSSPSTGSCRRTRSLPACTRWWCTSTSRASAWCSRRRPSRWEGSARAFAPATDVSRRTRGGAPPGPLVSRLLP